MNRHRVCIETIVPSSPAQVQDYVAELQHLETWWPQHWRYRRLRGDGGAGTRYYWIFVGMGAILPGLTTIEAREPGRLTYRTAMAGLPIRMNYEFSPAPQGTLVRGEMHSPALRFSFFAGMVRKQLVDAFARLSQASMPPAAAAESSIV